MSEQTYREKWRREVFKTPLLSDTVRVALLALAEEMDDDGMVSVKRDGLAGMLGKSGRRVSDRITAAIGRGFLERLSRGQRNGAGRFRAALPGGPSSGHHAVPKKPGLLGTPCRPEEDSLRDGFQHQENPSLGDTMSSPRDHDAPAVFGTPCRPEEAAPYIRNRARASGTGDRPEEPTPSPAAAGTDETTPNQTTTKVSQSARKREAFRYLNERYGLTEFEAASVIAEVTRRAPQPIRSLVPYLAAMKEGDLADIVAAIQARTDPQEPGGESEPTENPTGPRRAVTEWCGSCDQQTRQLELLDGRMRRCPACHPLREDSA